jgi:uncharacterized repeat protein (TIGR03803 family)
MLNSPPCVRRVKKSIKSLFPFLGRAWVLRALLTGLGLISAGRVAAQTFTNLHNFTGGTNGADPAAGLILSGNALYGTAFFGGPNGNGTVFALDIGGGILTPLHTFATTSGNLHTNNDGTAPFAGLILSDNTLFGTASLGGSLGRGTIFAVSTDGTGFTNLYNFTSLNYSSLPGTNSDGAMPLGRLILSGNRLYGTASGGGANGYGTVFAVNTDGTCFSNLYNFTAIPGGFPSGGTNSEGANPIAGLILSGNTLYGTASAGGTNGDGTVFALNISSGVLTPLYTFTATSGSLSPNSDGADPIGELVLSGNTLYGTTYYGGTNGHGTIFAIRTNGMDFTNLYSFADGNDGANPYSRLILSGNTLYGTAQKGGAYGHGAIFAVDTNGTGFTNLYSFTGGSDGDGPEGRLVLSSHTLYGTASEGGTAGSGTVFGLSLGPLPQLAIMLSGTNVVLTWTNTVTGFTLQSTANILPPAWSNVSPGPVIVNGQNTVTNPITGTQQFYQLSQ